MGPSPGRAPGPVLWSGAPSHPRPFEAPPALSYARFCRLRAGYALGAGTCVTVGTGGMTPG